MDPAERTELAQAVLDTSRGMLALAIRSVSSGTAPVTVVQHRVLVLLEGHGALTVNDVAAELGVDQSNASRHCSSLERLGLVTRTPAAHDGRSVEVALTAAGRRQVESVHAARLVEISRILDGLPDDSVREMVRAFRAFERASQEERATTPVI
jgi:DNA-binding MarR family transcriptional regulator